MDEMTSGYIMIGCLIGILFFVILLFSFWAAGTAAQMTASRIAYYNRANWTFCNILGYNSSRHILLKNCGNQSVQAIVGTTRNWTNSSTPDVLLQQAFTYNSFSLYIQETGPKSIRPPNATK